MSFKKLHETLCKRVVRNVRMAETASPLFLPEEWNIHIGDFREF